MKRVLHSTIILVSGVLSVFFLYSMEKDTSDLFYDIDALNKCTTFQEIRSVLVESEKNAFHRIQEHYKVPDDTWHTEVTIPIGRLKDCAREHYKSSPLFQPRRDPLIPQDLLINPTEEVAKRFGINPMRIDITYDKPYFTIHRAQAYAAQRNYSYILGIPDLWGNGTISYNLNCTAIVKKYKDYIETTIAHELVHLRDIHYIQRRITLLCIAGYTKPSNSCCYSGFKIKDICDSTVFKTLKKVHETMADTLPLLENIISRKSIQIYIDYAKLTFTSDTRPTSFEILSILNKIKAIANEQEANQTFLQK